MDESLLHLNNDANVGTPTYARWSVLVRHVESYDIRQKREIYSHLRAYTATIANCSVYASHPELSNALLVEYGITFAEFCLVHILAGRHSAAPKTAAARPNAVSA